MSTSTRVVVGFLCLLVASLLVGPVALRAQDPGPVFEQVVSQPRGLPQLPPQGAWGEVINVTSQWIVIQNHAGQQFPIAADDIGKFLVRWPSNVDNIGPQSLVEAIGRNTGTNAVLIGHLDVFEGEDRNLVQPIFDQAVAVPASLIVASPALGWLMNTWDFTGLSLLYGWAYPSGFADAAGPTRHVVGSVTQRYPLQVSLPGNNSVTLMAGEAGHFTVTQVTRGSLEMARKGDYAFLMPLQIKPRGLAVSQFVLYKSISFQQFLRAAPR